MKIEIWIRDITVEEDIRLMLPVEQGILTKKLKKNHEYIITDSSFLDCSEYENIEEVNKLLLLCEENGIDKNTLQVLQKAFLYKELSEIIESMNFVTLDFDNITSEWNYQYGVPDTEEWYGFVLFQEGYGRLPFEYTEDMEDYIRWELIWQTAETEGWMAIRGEDSHTYLVHR